MTGIIGVSYHEEEQISQGGASYIHEIDILLTPRFSSVPLYLNHSNQHETGVSITIHIYIQAETPFYQFNQNIKRRRWDNISDYILICALKWIARKKFKFRNEVFRQFSVCVGCLGVQRVLSANARCTRNRGHTL